RVHGPVQAAPANDENTWRTPRPRGRKTARCSESSCDAEAHPASTGEDGSQGNPPCDPHATPTCRPCRRHYSIRRASGLVQTRFPEGKAMDLRQIAESLTECHRG